MCRFNAEENCYNIENRINELNLRLHGIVSILFIVYCLKNRLEAVKYIITRFMFLIPVMPIVMLHFRWLKFLTSVC